MSGDIDAKQRQLPAPGVGEAVDASVVVNESNTMPGTFQYEVPGLDLINLPRPEAQGLEVDIHDASGVSLEVKSINRLIESVVEVSRPETIPRTMFRGKLVGLAKAKSQHIETTVDCLMVNQEDTEPKVVPLTKNFAQWLGKVAKVRLFDARYNTRGGSTTIDKDKLFAATTAEDEELAESLLSEGFEYYGKNEEGQCVYRLIAGKSGVLDYVAPAQKKELLEAEKHRSFSDDVNEHAERKKAGMLTDNTQTYWLEAKTVEGVVSKSTLAIIDSAVQLGRIAGVKLPMSVVLGYVYGNDVGRSYLSQKHAQSRTDFFQEITTKFYDETGFERPEFSGQHIFEELTETSLDLALIGDEFGDVANVREVTRESQLGLRKIALSQEIEELATGSIREIIDAGASPSEIIDILPEGQRTQLATATNIITETIEKLGDQPQLESFIESLIEDGIFPKDIVQVHKDGLGELFVELTKILQARRTIETVGGDVSFAETAAQAVVVNFLSKNETEINRTLMLRDEIVENLSSVVKYLIETGMEGRSIEEVSKALGNIALAQQEAIRAVVPNVVTMLREAVGEMGVEFEDFSVQGYSPHTENRRIWEYCPDYTGGTMVFKAEADCSSARIYLKQAIHDLGMSREIGVESNGDRQIILGSLEVRRRIPRDKWAYKDLVPADYTGPEALTYIRETRG